MAERRFRPLSVVAAICLVIQVLLLLTLAVAQGDVRESLDFWGADYTGHFDKGDGVAVFFNLTLAATVAWFVLSLLLLGVIWLAQAIAVKDRRGDGA